MSNELIIYRGDTPTISVVVKDSNGTIYDLTNYTMRITVKRYANDIDADAVIGPSTMTVTTPSNGTGIITLTATQTNLPSRKYVYDVQINTVASTIVHTVVEPTTFEIKDDVTKV